MDSFERLGWEVVSFQPKLSALADLEAKGIEGLVSECCKNVWTL